MSRDQAYQAHSMRRNHKNCSVLLCLKNWVLRILAFCCHHETDFFGKKSLLVNSSQGDLVGLEFKLEMSTSEISAEENNVDSL